MSVPKKMTHLRISVTQRCNLSCPYCHHEGAEGKPEKEMTLAEIDERAKAAYEFGIRKVKITGGEPLLRKDIADIVSIFCKRGFSDISLTTNGLLLEKYAKNLRTAGLNRVNIGCDSISSEYLAKKCQKIKSGIGAAKKAGLTPIKLNMVVLKGINDSEIGQMMDFARDNKCVLQLIELIRLNVSSDFYEKYHFSLEGIEAGLEASAQKIIQRNLQARRQYVKDGLTVEVIRPEKKGFCANCTKIRIASDGRLKPCLMRNDSLVEFEGIGSFEKALSLKVMGNEGGCD